MSIARMIAKWNTTLSHQRREITGIGGGRETTWSTETSAVACGVQPASARVMQQHAANQTVVTHSVFTKTNLGAKAEDRLVISDGRTMAVVGQVDQAGLGKLYRIDCKEVI